MKNLADILNNYESVVNITQVSQEELGNFINEHIEQKNDMEINNIEGNDLSRMELYKLGLYEGLINGIHWLGGTVEAIDYDVKDKDYHKIEIITDKHGEAK